jgi:hypothetical protein
MQRRDEAIYAEIELAVFGPSDPALALTIKESQSAGD